MEGDIVPLKGTKDCYRYKLEHYCILFRWEKQVLIWVWGDGRVPGDLGFLT